MVHDLDVIGRRARAHTHTHIHAPMQSHASPMRNNEQKAKDHYNVESVAQTFEGIFILQLTLSDLIFHKYP